MKMLNIGHRKYLTIVLLLISTISFSNTHNELDFLQKLEPIKKNLYKISAQELPKVLDIKPIEIPVIEADQLKTIMDEQPNALVVNVLPEKYHNDCHIKGSINAPLPEIAEHAQSWNRTQKIVVYCALDECDAGEKAAIILTYMGFKNVSDYKGGIKEWFQLHYPTQGPATSDYLHTKSMFRFDQEYRLYPDTIICSRQTRWMRRY